LVCLATLGCGPTTAPSDAASLDAPNATGAVCPPGGSTLTWASFGQAFFATYCTRCHASTLVGGGARSGAPAGLNWDEHATVMANAGRIDAVAGAGPRNVNTVMPLSGVAPTEAERRQLGEWLACGAP
jgi:uncharacterized membrane protein